MTHIRGIPKKHFLIFKTFDLTVFITQYGFFGCTRYIIQNLHVLIIHSFIWKYNMRIMLVHKPTQLWAHHVLSVIHLLILNQNNHKPSFESDQTSLGAQQLVCCQSSFNFLRNKEIFQNIITVPNSNKYLVHTLKTVVLQVTYFPRCIHC